MIFIYAFKYYLFCGIKLSKKFVRKLLEVLPADGIVTTRASTSGAGGAVRVPIKKGKNELSNISQPGRSNLSSWEIIRPEEGSTAKSVYTIYGFIVSPGPIFTLPDKRHFTVIVSGIVVFTIVDIISARDDWSNSLQTPFAYSLKIDKNIAKIYFYY